MTKMILYARISSEKQADNSSLDNQVNAMSEYCNRNIINIVRVVREVGSASSGPRPEFFDALKEMESDLDIDGLMVYDIDRFFRNTQQGLSIYKDYFDDNNKRLISLQQSIDTATPEGWFTFTMFLAVAEYTNRQHQRRMRAGADAAKARGQKGSGPLGYAQSVSESGELLIDFDSPGYKIVARCMAKGYGICRTTNELQWANVYNDSGKPFSKSSVIGMIAKLAQKEEEDSD